MKAKETAIVLIEFQNEFCKPDGKLYGVVKDEIARLNTVANAVKLAKEARARGALIIHSPFVMDENWVNQQCMVGIIKGAKEGGAFKPGAWGTELIDELKPQPGDVVLTGKRALSGFSNTELKAILDKHKIKNVVCAGFLANVCVEATARSAYDYGFHVTVARNAVASGAKTTQDYVEKEIYPVLGQALSVDEVIKALE
ncbi:MAG TPA: cysteine hydrolase [Planctomycetota bacterium]|nr:cysteine hydrolase [Planctomycetota bacterium]